MSEEKTDWIPIILFPVTLYLFIGTSLFYILHKMEQLISVLGYYSNFPGIETYSPRDWHDISILLTASFPVTWPLILVWTILVLLYSIIASFLRIIHKAVVSISSLISGLSDNIRNWTIDSIDDIWQTVKDVLP